MWLMRWRHLLHCNWKFTSEFIIKLAQAPSKSSQSLKFCNRILLGGVSLYIYMHVELWNVSDDQYTLQTGEFELLLRKFLVEDGVFLLHTASLFLRPLARIWLEIKLQGVKHRITAKRWSVKTLNHIITFISIYKYCSKSNAQLGVRNASAIVYGYLNVGVSRGTVLPLQTSSLMDYGVLTDKKFRYYFHNDYMIMLWLIRNNGW